MERNERQAIIDGLALTVKSVFVPFSQSRNAKEKFPSLNWRVSILRDGREILETDYGAGCGHAPSSKNPPRNCGGYLAHEAVKFECETGKAARVAMGGIITPQYDKSILPDSFDVLSSLALDASVLDCAGFADWASEFGYDIDSRNAESIYRACLDIALKLRAALGDAGLETLRSAFQDY
jgi:hypothetical protein